MSNIWLFSFKVVLNCSIDLFEEHGSGPSTRRNACWMALLHISVIINWLLVIQFSIV